MFHFKLTRLIFNVLWLTDSYQSRSLPLTSSLLPGLLKAINRTNLPLPTWGNLSGMRSLQPQLRGGMRKKTMIFPMHAQMYITQMGGPMHEQPRLRKTNAWRCLRWAKSLYGKQNSPMKIWVQNFCQTWGPSDKNQKELDDDSVGTIQVPNHDQDKETDNHKKKTERTDKQISRIQGNSNFLAELVWRSGGLQKRKHQSFQVSCGGMFDFLESSLNTWSTI